MRLSKFSYSIKSKFDIWTINHIELGETNLIVGRNATGKSKFLTEIDALADYLSNNEVLPNVEYGESEFIWEVEFIDEKQNLINYKIRIGEFDNGKRYQDEKLVVNNLIVAERNQSYAKIYSSLSNSYININPPDDILIINSRRDKDEFPFFEKIIKWAKGFKLVRFSQQENLKFYDLDTAEEIVRLDKKALKSVISNINALGYEIDDITVDKTTKFNHVFIKEKNLYNLLGPHEISTGMYRTLGLLAYIEFNLAKDYVSTIAIDDLSEGLDYERATKLGKLLVKKLENSNIQFIATSNDSFLMDVIPIKYWNILRRDGNTVSSFNYQNSKERFDKFLMTGLSNFDLFSSNYLMRPKP